MKRILGVAALSMLILICFSTLLPGVSHGETDETSGVSANLPGTWMICDPSIEEMPVALEIPGDGFVTMRALKSMPPFKQNAYDQWIFKPAGDNTATAKSPGGEEMSLTLEKAGDENLLEVRMGDTLLFLYRPRNETGRQGFTGTWNMPALPVISFQEDGALSFQAGNPVGKGETGRYAILGGNKIAVYATDNNGVEIVIVVLEPTDDANRLKVSVNEDDYREAGEKYDKPPSTENEAFFIVKGPSAGFFYQQPIIAKEVNNIRTARIEADFNNCSGSLYSLQSAQSDYYNENGTYAFDASQLDQYTYQCTDYGNCEGNAMASVEEFCLPGSFTIGPGHTGDGNSYKMTAKSKDDPPCNICVSDLGYYPEYFVNCPNDDMFCGH